MAVLVSGGRPARDALRDSPAGRLRVRVPTRRALARMARPRDGGARSDAQRGRPAPSDRRTERHRLAVDTRVQRPIRLHVQRFRGPGTPCAGTRAVWGVEDRDAETAASSRVRVPAMNGRPSAYGLFDTISSAAPCSRPRSSTSSQRRRLALGPSTCCAVSSSVRSFASR